MGSNGLDPMDQLAESTKCKASPSKRKYTRSSEAWDAARKRSEETKLDIVAYACADCGYFHLTKNKTGSDVLAKTPIGITTGALRKYTPGSKVMEFPERVELPNVTPIVPGNQDARRKALALFLKDRDTVKGPEALAVLGIKATSSLGPYMREAGWEVVSHGRSAYWARKSEGKPIVSITPVPEVKGSVDRYVEESMARHPSAQNAWRDVDLHPLSPTMTLKDLLDVYKSAGLEFQVRVRDANHPNGSGA